MREEDAAQTAERAFFRRLRGRPLEESDAEVEKLIQAVRAAVDTA